MDKVATPLNPSDVLDKTSKFFRVMEKEGVPWEKFQLPIDNRTARRNLAEYLKLGCPKAKNGLIITHSGSDYSLAREILGNDFILPDEIARARNWELPYSDEQLHRFTETLPSEEVLQWLHDNGFILVTGSPKPMSLLEIRDLNPKLFYNKTGGWYANESEKFSREDKVNPEWLMLRKTPVPNSTNKTWSNQQKLISEMEYVPNAASVVWGLTTYKEVRNEYLLPNVYVGTSSVGSDGSRVFVGDFDGDGLVVNDCSDDNYGSDLGVASARK